MEVILITALILAAICVSMAMKKTGKQKKGESPPEAAGAWPVLGHIRLLGADQLLHRTLATMADKYGPIFSVRLGVHRAVVVSNWEVAKECFTVNDRSLSTRPRSLALKNMGYDRTMFGFAPYGPYWRDMRKLAMFHLLSVRRLELLHHVPDSETKLLVQGFYRQWIEKGAREPILVEMKEVFGKLAWNITIRKIAGRRYSGAEPESRRYQNTFSDFSRHLGAFFVSDAVPALAWSDVINGNVGNMKKTGKEIEDLLVGLVKEHRQKKLVETMPEDEKDFIDLMLSAMDDGQMSAEEVNTAIIGTCMNLVFGGLDTTGVALTWALSLLLNNPDKLKKLQDELEVHIGNHQPVDAADITKLTYLQAVVKETIRLCPPGPLLPREALEDCTISGYRVPNGTILYVNVWKLHRDPTIWRNPSEFVPERFLREHAKLNATGGQDFEYLPFGSGRRMCPGAAFALQSIHLTLARLLHAFEPKTMSDMPVDMTEGPGLVSPKATPLEVLLTPSETAGLYT